MKKFIFYSIITTTLAHMPLAAVSIVYNFRIAQVTRQPIAAHTQKRPNSLSVLLFDFFQKTRTQNIRENYIGGITTYNRNFAEKYYLRTDFACAHTHQTIKQKTTANVTETDDILFTVGRNILAHEKLKVSISGLFGIPTHAVHTLQRVGFGTGQVGVGVQLDGLYHLKQKVDFLWGTRYNYFIPRNAFDAQCNSYKFTIGSIADILIAAQTSNPLSHGLEGGYAARWGFGIKATPTIAQLDSFNYMRNNFYLVYKYTFLRQRFAHRLLLNISYGYDVKPERLGYNAVMIWGSWGVAF
ncbi:hypothetical protein KBD08_00375 [Candidatus Babeliales bacterium]|nr:hypothetical protein [Candidatus Babeliales bacterium]